MDHEQEQSQGQQPTSPAEEFHEEGLPGSGKGRKEKPGRSGVYPMSAGVMPPSGDAPVVDMNEFGQGDRGAAGYEDHGGSELEYIPPSGEPSEENKEYQVTEEESRKKKSEGS
ncbi:hypothetical protein [Nitrolancea hollandica]|uniref:Uncharacterized protein n=1 Tax=Nitrolancea hollandica Lb TaxID=1129897 RepID=I4EIR9_9BACT|nr:hypothetical protein [Nitrolancea hollandica]CCF84581.1 hypothetical protein NITHO_360012 [Nitrolancea hollandica Lb]